MDWIFNKPPKLYQEVIICSDDKRVKAATYLGDGKYNTFLKVVCWQPMPDAPEEIEGVESGHHEPDHEDIRTILLGMQRPVSLEQQVIFNYKLMNIISYLGNVTDESIMKIQVLILHQPHLVLV